MDTHTPSSSACGVPCLGQLCLWFRGVRKVGTEAWAICDSGNAKGPDASAITGDIVSYRFRVRHLLPCNFHLNHDHSVSTSQVALRTPPNLDVRKPPPLGRGAKRFAGLAALWPLCGNSNTGDWDTSSRSVLGGNMCVSGLVADPAGFPWQGRQAPVDLIDGCNPAVPHGPAELLPQQL